LRQKTRDLAAFAASDRSGINVGSVSGTLKPRGRGTRPGLKISAATVTAAAATVGAVLVIGPGGAAAAGGPGYALAASDSRCTPGRRGR